MMDTAAAARAVAGRALGPAAVFSRVTTDSRAVAPGDLFVALAGERFDGHDYVAAALAAGAAAALVADDRADGIKAASSPSPIRSRRSARSPRTGARASTCRSPPSSAATARPAPRR